MSFSEYGTRYNKGTRACSVILALLIVCSMFFVGKIGSIDASADTIPANTTIYVDCTDGWWGNDHTTNNILAVWWGSSQGGQLYELKHVENLVYSMTFDSSCNGFILFRLNTDNYTRGFGTSSTWPSSGVHNQTGNIENYSSGNNCIKIESDTAYSWTTYTPTTTDTDSDVEIVTGNDLVAKQGYGETVGSTKLQPVAATFYDYYTDYEVTNGWRSVVTNKNGTEASRTWENSFPFDKVNTYISNIAGTNEWQLPMYFGNFYTGNSWAYEGYARAISFESNGNPGGTNVSAELSKFSSQVNNSSYLNPAQDAWEKYDSGTSISVTGLVNSTLTNNQLTMGTGSVVAPYFSDELITNGLATKVSTVFPMRVENKTTTNGTGGDTVSYKMYEFDSTDGKDNVYFTDYGNTNFAINYSSYSNTVNDAKGGFGGSNGIGFFPFDNGGDAYDFGFGMRLDIPFNLGEGGYIAGTEEPIKFTFSGDDDVWVFVDGQLALDLGGAHTKASGEINFATKEATISTGIYSMQSGNVFGNPTSYNTGSIFQGSTGSSTTVDLSSVIDNSDPSDIHTLTVFYMERGMVESNLKMSFTLSPITNMLSVKQAINVDNVNSAIKESVKTYIEGNEKFNFSFSEKDTTGNSVSTTDYQYSVYGGTETTLGSNAVSVNTGELISFDNQFNSGNKIKVTETFDSNNKYTYSTGYTVTDKYKNEQVTTGDTAYTGADGFTFKTDSTDEFASDIFHVDYLNTVEVGSLTLKKVLKNNDGTDRTGDNTEFEFDVTIKIPGASSFVAPSTKLTTDSKETSAGHFKLGAGESVVINGLPVGTQVKITETAVDGYTVSGSETVTSTIESTSGSTVTYTNKKNLTPITATPTAKKTIDGNALSNSSARFNFTLTNDADSNDTQTKQNNGNGVITFDEITFEQKGDYWYTIKETTGGTTGYTLDTNTYKVKFVVTESNSALSVTTEYYKADKTAKIAEVVFNNTTIQTKGNLVIVKTDSKGNTTDEDSNVINFAGTTFAIYKVSGNGVAPTANATATATKSVTLDSTDNTYKATFSDLEEGWYAILETKAPTGYELSGEYKYVEVKASETTEHSFADTESADLPNTGGMGVVIFVVVGVALVLVAIVLFKPKKEKTQVENKTE